jgi:hypothetical protein
VSDHSVHLILLLHLPVAAAGSQYPAWRRRLVLPPGTAEQLFCELHEPGSTNNRKLNRQTEQELQVTESGSSCGVLGL